MAKSSASAAAAAPPSDGAALRPAVVAARGPWKDATRQLAEFRESLVAGRLRLDTIPQDVIAATIAADPNRLTELRAEREGIEELLTMAPAVEQGLMIRERDLSLTWSSAWTRYSDAMKAELFGPLAGRRAELEAAEALAQAEYERLTGDPDLL